MGLVSCVAGSSPAGCANRNSCRPGPSALGPPVEQHSPARQFRTFVARCPGLHTQVSCRPTRPANLPVLPETRVLESKRWEAPRQVPGPWSGLWVVGTARDSRVGGKVANETDAGPGVPLRHMEGLGEGRDGGRGRSKFRLAPALRASRAPPRCSPSQAPSAFMRFPDKNANVTGTQNKQGKLTVQTHVVACVYPRPRHHAPGSQVSSRGAIRPSSPRSLGSGGGGPLHPTLPAPPPEGKGRAEGGTSGAPRGDPLALLTLLPGSFYAWR